MLRSFPRREDRAQHIGIELTMEIFLRDGLQRQKIIDAGIVSSGYPPYRSGDRILKKTLYIGCYRHIGLNRDGLTAFGRDIAHDPGSPRPYHWNS